MGNKDEKAKQTDRKDEKQVTVIDIKGHRVTSTRDLVVMSGVVIDDMHIG